MEVEAEHDPSRYRAMNERRAIEEMRPGDVVRFEPSEKHWHGASPATAMTHIAVQEALDGKAVEWLEQVSDGGGGINGSFLLAGLISEWTTADFREPSGLIYIPRGFAEA